ncbi:hypothetical protein [Nocardia sp. NPDC051570]|uniref:hypothetical protein n=1 Tax=Nocardia sp. NPDC051570 TaxID=3364324 RepID=UPI0037AB458A
MKDSAAARMIALAGLARVLDVPVARIEYLLEVSAEDLTTFRHQVVDHLFGAVTTAGFSRIVAATRVLPAPVAAKVATHNNSPLMTAHLATAMETSRALGVAKRLPAAFLAQVAAYLDLRRSAPLIAGLPATLAAAVARELADRQDWLTLGELIEITSDDQLTRCLSALDAGEIVTLASHSNDPAMSDRIAGMVSEPLAEQLRGTAMSAGEAEG